MKLCKHRGSEAAPGWWECRSDRIRVKHHGKLVKAEICTGDGERQCPHRDRDNIVGASLLQVGVPAKGPGTELSLILFRLGVPPCQACHALAQQMDRWGPHGCRERRAQIVEQIFERAKALNWLGKLAAAVAPSLVKQRIGGYVDRAIEAAEKNAPAQLETTPPA